MDRASRDPLRSFHETGYAVIRGALAAEIEWISTEFDAVFREAGIVPSSHTRTYLVPFLDRSKRLCTLLDHPGLLSVLERLIGTEFQYLGGDGNYFAGDTPWHRDTDYGLGFVKVLLYLEPLKRETGCLQVLPGTHRPGEALTRWESELRSGCSPEGEALENRPGDLVVFDHHLYHASFGGQARRALALNFCPPCETPEQQEHLRRYIASFRRFWTMPMHGDALRNGAPPERLRHLRQYPIFSRRDALRLLMRRLNHS